VKSNRDASLKLVLLDCDVLCCEKLAFVAIQNDELEVARVCIWGGELSSCCNNFIHFGMALLHLSKVNCASDSTERGSSVRSLDSVSLRCLSSCLLLPSFW